MRRPPQAGRSSYEALAETSEALRALPPPQGVSPLRWRLMRLCLTPDGGPCPERLDALRRMTLGEALQLERVAHHRQREAYIMQDIVAAAAKAKAEREAAARARAGGG